MNPHDWRNFAKWRTAAMLSDDVTWPNWPLVLRLARCRLAERSDGSYYRVIETPYYGLG